MQTAVYVRNGAPHSALANERPNKAFYGKDAHLGHLRAIGAWAFVHVETHTKELEHRAWKGRLVGYIVDSKSFRVYNSSTRSVRESRKVIFIETPSVLPDPDLVSGFDEGEFTYDDYDDMIRDVRNYTSKLDLSSPAAADRAGLKICQCGIFSSKFVKLPTAILISTLLAQSLLEIHLLTCLLYTSPSPRD